MANLMDLVRELKGLNARKKAGEVLTAAEETRRKELKAYLRTTLEAQGGGNSLEDSAIKEPPQRSSSAPKPVPAASSAPKPVPTPAVAVAAQQPSPATKTAPRPVSTPTAQPMTSTEGFDDVLPPVMQKGKLPGTPLPGMGAPPPPARRMPEPLDEDVPPPQQQVRGGRPMVESLDEDVPPPAQPAAGPKPFVPKKNPFAIDAGLAGDLISAASKSEAVNKVDPFSNRKAHASAAEVEEAEQRAEAAIRANKKKDRARNADEAVEQLQQTEATYTPPEDSFVMEQYYGDFVSDGFTPLDAREAPDLKPIDPREIELAKLDSTGGPGGGATSAAVPNGLAFLDDFPALYARRVLPPPDDEVVVDSTDPSLLIPGKRKVTVHLLNGEKKQGAIRSLRRGELGFKLEPIGSGATEELSISQVKAVFIHLQPNAAPNPNGGRNLTATFRDGRAVQGTSDDYQPGAPVFTLVPSRQFERIIVNGAAVQSVQ